MAHKDVQNTIHMTSVICMDQNIRYSTSRITCTLEGSPNYKIRWRQADSVPRIWEISVAQPKVCTTLYVRRLISTTGASRKTLRWNRISNARLAVSCKNISPWRLYCRQLELVQRWTWKSGAEMLIRDFGKRAYWKMLWTFKIALARRISSTAQSSLTKNRKYPVLRNGIGIQPISIKKRCGKCNDDLVRFEQQRSCNVCKKNNSTLLSSTCQEPDGV